MIKKIIFFFLGPTNSSSVLEIAVFQIQILWIWIQAFVESGSSPYPEPRPKFLGQSFLNL